jgi:hypothetical protein
MIRIALLVKNLASASDQVLAHARGQLVQPLPGLPVKQVSQRAKGWLIAVNIRAFGRIIVPNMGRY